MSYPGLRVTLVPKEADVKTDGGRWYTMHIQPYRTLDNVIEGAVLTFVDITEAQKLKEALRKSEGKYRTPPKKHPADKSNGEERP